MIVVTGAAGLVGANLVRSLLEGGQQVRALIHQDSRALDGLDVELIQADVRDPAALVNAFEKADIVFHLAALISLEMDSWSQVEAVNVSGTRHVVEACLKSGVRRLVHCSSIHALVQEPFDTPVDENRPLVSSHRLPPYDRSKAAGEREIGKGRQKGLETVIIRPTAVVGPYDYKPSYVGSALVQIAQRRLPLLVGGGFDWVDVRDVVDGMVQASLTAPSGSQFLLSGHWKSVLEIAQMVEAATGVKAPRFVVPLGLAEVGLPFFSLLAQVNTKLPVFKRASLAALRSNRHISHARASRFLGYAPRPISETISDTLAWFSNHGMLRDGLLK